MQVLRADTPTARAKMDLKFHFSKSILMQSVRSAAYHAVMLTITKLFIPINWIGILKKGSLHAPFEIVIISRHPLPAFR